MTLNRAALVSTLQEKRITNREAKKIVNTIIESMTDALCRGETVQLPGGCIKVLKRKERKAGFRRYKDPNTGKAALALLRSRRPGSRVKFIPDGTLDFTTPPTPPLTRDELHCRRLVQEYLGYPPDEATMARLEQAAQRLRPRPNALLRCMKVIRSKGFTGSEPYLISDIDQHYFT